jgi:hypothetical protein
MLNMQFFFLISIMLLSCFSFVVFSLALQSNIPFEKRLQEQISNNSINSSFANNKLILDMPRNITNKQIQNNSPTINTLYNESTANILANTLQTQQNISNIISLLK